MNIEYRKAKPEEAERVCYIVQYTKEVIYPDYYTKAVMDFFGSLHSIDNIKKDIEQKYQGHGYGSKIMNELEKEIFNSFNSCVLEASLPACIFYENR